ncbi:ring-h2 finger protein atl5f [Nannochloropsis gaditana]|uniref:RING-type E3 ubiquitin transferase n=1 Tax=Nannochloropsis gaditana TaxID=72520 RepID=W7T9A8_9STRA|nr:ring-h2 finger protein atl5f [Nannochloropsis gaditana]
MSPRDGPSPTGAILGGTRWALGDGGGVGGDQRRPSLNRGWEGPGRGTVQMPFAYPEEPDLELAESGRFVPGPGPLSPPSVPPLSGRTLRVPSFQPPPEPLHAPPSLGASPASRPGTPSHLGPHHSPTSSTSLFFASSPRHPSPSLFLAPGAPPPRRHHHHHTHRQVTGSSQALLASPPGTGRAPSSIHTAHSSLGCTLGRLSGPYQSERLQERERRASENHRSHGSEGGSRWDEQLVGSQESAARVPRPYLGTATNHPPHPPSLPSPRPPSVPPPPSATDAWIEAAMRQHRQRLHPRHHSQTFPFFAPSLSSSLPPFAFASSPRPHHPPRHPSHGPRHAPSGTLAGRHGHARAPGGGEEREAGERGRMGTRPGVGRGDMGRAGEREGGTFHYFSAVGDGRQHGGNGEGGEESRGEGGREGGREGGWSSGEAVAWHRDMMEWFLSTRTEVSAGEGGEGGAFERRGAGPSPSRPPNFADSDGPRRHWASHPADFLSPPSLPSSPPPPLSHVLHVHGEGGREGEGEDEEMGGRPTRLSRRHPQLSLFSPSPSSSVSVPAPRQEGPVPADVPGAGTGRDAGGGLGSWEREGNEEEREDTLWLASAFVDLDVDAMGYEELLLLGELIGPAKKAGLSPSQVEDLPAHPFLPRSLFRHLISPGKSCRGGEEGGERGLMCVVCLCEVEEGETVRTLPRCGHRFHGPGCVDVWLESHNSCPVCKAVVVVGGREEGKTAEV